MPENKTALFGLYVIVFTTSSVFNLGLSKFQLFHSKVSSYSGPDLLIKCKWPCQSICQSFGKYKKVKL